MPSTCWSTACSCAISLPSTDLVQSVLGRLANARGGAESLLKTLDAYFATGSVTTETARRLHLSVRAVTYRLDRIKTLTGHDPTDPHSGSPSTPQCSARSSWAGRKTTWADDDRQYVRATKRLSSSGVGTVDAAIETILLGSGTTASDTSIASSVPTASIAAVTPEGAACLTRSSRPGP